MEIGGMADMESLLKDFQQLEVEFGENTNMTKGKHIIVVVDIS